MNLLDEIKGQFTSEAVNQLSSLIGANHETTHSALGATIPAILAGLTKLASTSAGATTLQKQLNPANLPSSGDLGSILSGNSAELIEKGIGILGALFGGNALGTIVSAISKFSGLNSESAKKLIGLALPFVLSTISKQVKGLGADGITKLLTSQKDSVTRALPPGFSLDGLTPSVEAPAGGLPGWLLPALGLAALALAALYFLQPAATEKPAEPGAAADPTAVTPGPKVELPKVELPKVEIPDAAVVGTNVTNFFAGLTDTFNGIKDPATAEASLPKIKDAEAKLDELKATLDKLSGETKTKIVDLIKTGIEKFKELSTKVLSSPAVTEKIKPAFEALLKKLETLLAPTPA